MSAAAPKESTLQSTMMDEAALRAALKEPPLHKTKHFTAKTAAVDTATAALVAVTAAVPISIIDYSIIARVAGVSDSTVRELWKGCKTCFLRPHKFFLPCKENKCALVYAVCVTSYFFTYTGSNLSKSYCESHGMASSANLAAGVASGVINTLLSIWKDGVILQALPPANPNDIASAVKPVPWLTRGLFAGRDILTCVGAFTLAPMLANWITRYAYHHKKLKDVPNAKLPEDEGKVRLPISAADTAQILTPALLQFVTTILHISAIRYRQTYPKFDYEDLKRSLKATYLPSTFLRMGRIFPAFGLGGIMNRNVRSDLLDKVDP